MNFKKIGIIFLLLTVITFPAAAAEVLTLEEAMERAETENMDLKLTKIDYQKSKINLKNLELQNEFNYTETQSIEINKNYLDSQKNYQDSKAEIIKSVIQQYTNLWLLQKEIEAQELTTRAEERLYNEMQARFELAQISKIDLLDQSNQYNDASNELENLRDNYEQSLIEFKTALNLENQEIEIKELAAPEIWEITEEEALEKGIAESNTIKIAELGLELAKKEFQKNKIEASSSEQKTAELDLQAAEISLEKAEKDLENEIIKAHLSLQQAEKNIELMKNNLEKAESQYQQTRRQFDLGSVTQTALLQYEASLVSSEYQLKNAHLNYYLAKEDLADLLNMEPGVTINEQK
ncbi:outer membrane efflux protein [Halanaerobium saccharolyticum]|uniref:Outer membrane efflux protein n=1 Tax=Halanaerobium saccharolyticum TaxID=43595 RepID=A0A4R7YK60_9FIRM|nr:TolC family protein [Halanaerobium saccharolyticum]RAK04112.1 outer membrane efflux protein [Halanaerobium saccharolyticum]TDV97886.1 outer membrane efflux protein [Halanaerobium saccharolyticum]TDX50989.1 outer membrane efflux protein [Halanaerobium saccharolyticum]